MTVSTLKSARDASHAPAFRIAALLLGIGTVHFIRPERFDEIVPAELPGSARLYTYVSGVAEIVIGSLLIVRRTRRLASLAATALFIAVFPANLNQVRLWWGKPWKQRLIALVRLPMQIPMITEALKVYRTA